MSNPYLAYVEEDPQLHAAIEPALNKLNSLTPEQIEKLVFFLKSLHTYYPKSENHVAYLEQFSKRLDQLRNSDEQRKLQQQATGSILKGMGLCLLSGALLSAAAVFGLGGAYPAGIGAALAGLTLLLIADSKLFRRALVVSKEQDRRYFLSCIRVSSACNELDWSGLFAYHRATKSGSHSDEDLKQVHAAIAEITANLRAALYNDEFLQYSDTKLSERSGDA